MGRKEASSLPNVPSNSMEQQTMKVRPVLLKRKSFDTSDPTKQTNHRKNKSQQVRFKEDSTTQDAPDFVGSESKHSDNILLVNGKAEKSHNRSMCLLAYPHSQKGLQNIAIQTSPSLRKHFPNFKAKKATATRSKGILSTEFSCAQVNGELSDDDKATQISHFRLSDQFEEGLKQVRRSPLLHTVPKAQSNGPISECSGSQFVEMLEPASISIQVTDNPTKNPLEKTEKSNTDLQMYKTFEIPVECSIQSNLNILQPSDVCVDQINICDDAKQADIFCPLKQNELLPKKTNVECKRTLTLSPSFNSNLSYRLQPEHQQTDKLDTIQDSAPPHNDSHEQTSFRNLDEVQAKETDITRPPKTTTETTGCTDASMSSLPKTGILHGAHNDSKPTNPGHMAHGQFCSLQGKLQNVEESLQSNQEKIKILLNVIQDMEKARAFSEGYSTDFKLKNNMRYLYGFLKKNA